MSEHIRNLQEFVRFEEAKNPEMDQGELASEILLSMNDRDKEIMALDWVQTNIWSVRRERQLRIEREASRGREKEYWREENEKRERDRKDRKDRKDYIDLIHEENRLKEEAAFDRRMIKLGPKFKDWIVNPSLVPLDFLTGGPVSTMGNNVRYGRVGNVTDFRDWIKYEAWKEPGFKNLPEFPRITSSSSRILLSACEAHGIPRDNWFNILLDWCLPYDALDWNIHLEIEKASQQIRLEVSAELLGSEFALGDGVRVTWGSATVDQHLQRASLTTSNAVSNAEDAARHLAAVRMIQERGANTLGEANERVAA